MKTTLHMGRASKKAESALETARVMLDEYIRSASVSESDLADGKYVELESRYLDVEGEG